MCLIPPLDVQETLFLAGMKPAQWHCAESQGRHGFWEVDAQRALSAQSPRSARGMWLSGIAPLGRRLRHTEVARPMSE